MPHSVFKKTLPPVEKLNRPDMTAPLPRKDFSRFLLACKQIGDKTRHSADSSSNLRSGNRGSVSDFLVEPVRF